MKYDEILYDSHELTPKSIQIARARRRFGINSQNRRRRIANKIYKVFSEWLNKFGG